jgi:predicted nucleic acid-binding protein
MTTLVVDASVVGQWFFPEQYSSEARRLLSPRYTVLAPELVLSEFGNIAWKRFRRGEMTEDEATQCVADMVRLPLQIVPTQGLIALALELAIATDRSVYDCLYLATALDRKCRLVTADERFVNSLTTTPLAKHIRHVAKIA